MPRPKGSKNKTPKQREKERLEYEKNKRPVGRPSKFDKINLDQVERLAMFGRLDLADIAVILGINQETLHAWKKKYPEFSNAIKKGRAKANFNVKKKMYERATGYSHPEEKIFCFQGEIIKTKTIKHYPPEPAAFIFWLCNQEPDEWKRDRKQKEDEGNRTEDLRAVVEILDRRNKKKK